MIQELTARDYLKIDIANNFGKPAGFSKKLDKCDWDVRIKWFDENQHQLNKLIDLAEDRPLFFAGVQAWKDVEAGKPIGYPISLDGCSSGQFGPMVQ